MIKDGSLQNRKVGSRDLGGGGKETQCILALIILQVGERAT